MSSIETLHELPKLEHDEVVGGYAYPEEYRNKLFIFNSQYIYIKQGSYDIFPKIIFDSIIEHCIQTMNFETQQNDEGVNIDEYKFKLSELENKIDNFNLQFEKIYEELESKITDQQISDNFYSTIDNTIKTMDFSFLKSTLDENRVKEIIQEELMIVHHNLPQVVSNVIQENELIHKTENLPTIIEHKQLSLSKLVVLKEAGYTISEIKELVSSGLV